MLLFYLCEQNHGILRHKKHFPQAVEVQNLTFFDILAKNE